MSAEVKHGPFIETRSGLRFHPLEPKAADIRISDIAHALSNQCRFSGHTREHYSVAEHSVRVSNLLEEQGYSKEMQLWGLLHDASEAYLVDLPSPLKQHPAFAFYYEAEAEVMRQVCIRFWMPEEMPDVVKEADAILLATEVRDLMPFHAEHWAKLTHNPLDEKILPWDPEFAREQFIERFREISE